MDAVYMPRVLDAEYIKDYMIRVMFTDGKAGVVDCRKYIDGPIFEPLKDQEYFSNFFVDGWTISWSNGADIAPETLYNDVQS